MAATVTVEQDVQVSGNNHFYLGTFTISTSYATGGEPFDISTNERFDVVVVGTANGGYVCRWDRDNQKLLIYQTKDPGAAGGADVPLQQVANAANIQSAFGTAVFFAWGQ